MITPQKEEYDFNYFYDSSVDDFGMAASLNYTCAANVFQGLKGSDSQTEYVKAVQVGFYGSGATCDVKVYTNLQDQQDMSDLANGTPPWAPWPPAAPPPSTARDITLYPWSSLRRLHRAAILAL